MLDVKLYALVVLVYILQVTDEIIFFLGLFISFSDKASVSALDLL